MHQSYARSPGSLQPRLSYYATVACLFCMLGVAVSAAVLPMFPADDITWTVAHLE